MPPTRAPAEIHVTLYLVLHNLDAFILLLVLLLLQWSWKVWSAQRVLGGLYERIYDTIRGRGVPPEDETNLWACLARIKDKQTGEKGGGGATCPRLRVGGKSLRLQLLFLTSFGAFQL
jgi:hypothetical protein